MNKLSSIDIVLDWLEEKKKDFGISSINIIGYRIRFQYNDNITHMILNGWIDFKPGEMVDFVANNYYCYPIQAPDFFDWLEKKFMSLGSYKINNEHD